MLRIGITGGIGSGKSTITHIFKVLGIAVFDADATAKRIMDEDETLKQDIRATFGDEAYVDGKLNRKYLAGKVFGNPYQLEKLNALVHPAAIAAGEAWTAQQTTPYTVKEAALFFESGSAANMDYIIGVYAPKALRLQRAMHRDHITRQEVLDRMDRQIDEQLKMKLCDFVIINDEQQPVLPQVLQLHEKFLSLSK